MCNPLRSASSMEVVDSARDLNMCGDALTDNPKNASTLRTRVAPKPDAAQHSGAVYTWKQIALHNTTDDAWVVIKGKVRQQARVARQNHGGPFAAQVYDVTLFGRHHPGGNVIYKFAGRDATDAFSAFHSPTAWSMMRSYAVGTLDESEQLVRQRVLQHTTLHSTTNRTPAPSLPTFARSAASFSPRACSVQALHIMYSKLHPRLLSSLLPTPSSGHATNPHGLSSHQPCSSA